MRKGFFLLFEFLLALLLFSSVYAATLLSSPTDDSTYRLSEIICHDLLSVWLLGEDDLSSAAAELLPPFSFTLSTGPLSSQKSHSVSCVAYRTRHSSVETQYILIEW